MKSNFSILLLLLSFTVLAQTYDDIRIKANHCLILAQDTKTSEAEFRKSLNAVKALCRTENEKKYFEELKILAETKFKMRPLVTAVLRFSCKDPALALSVKPMAVSELLETSLDSSFSKVTRKDLAKAIEELNLQNSDLFEKSAGTQVGTFVKAQYIITGNIQKVSDEILITARCIEVATGKIVKDGQIKLKNAREMADAVPALARQLSINRAQTNLTTLSTYAIKYLNAANKKLADENFILAADNIARSNMFLSEKTYFTSLIPLQMFMSSSVCGMSRRDYGTSTQKLDQALKLSKKIFGENDEVVIHHYNSLAQHYLHNGNFAKAAEANNDAFKHFQRTKEFRAGRSNPFAGFEHKVKLYKNKDKIKYDLTETDSANNSFIIQKFKQYTSKAARVKK